MRAYRIFFLVTTTVVAGTCGTFNDRSTAGGTTPADLGISFIPGSTSTLRMERDGRTYEVDVVAQTVREIDPPPGAPSSQVGGVPATGLSGQPGGAPVFAKNCATCHGADARGVAGLRTPDFTDPKIQASLKDDQIVTTIENGKPGTMMPAWAGKLSQQQILAVAGYLRSLGTTGLQAQGASQLAGTKPHPHIYEPGDDSVFTLPTGRRLDAHGLYVNFTHRFAFDPAFSGIARGGALLGLDGFSLSSFGFRYGVTKNFSVSIFRSPTFISRPIQMMGAYNFLSESDGAAPERGGPLFDRGTERLRQELRQKFRADSLPKPGPACTAILCSYFLSRRTPSLFA